MLKTKSVSSPIDPKTDGLRILATRFRGRGLETSRYDVWMANLGPSEALLRDYQSKKLSAVQFAQAYRKEMFAGGVVDSRCRTIKNHGQKFTLRLIKELARRQDVTLLCHCDEDFKGCHRHVLQKLILNKTI